MTRTIQIMLLILCSLGLSAQDGTNKSLSQLPDDTNKVILLNQKASELFYPDPVQANQLLDQAISIAEKIKFDRGLATASGGKATLLFYQMKLDSATWWNDRAMALVKNKKDSSSKNQLAQLLIRYAAIFQQRQKYDSAVARYLESVELFNSIGQESKAIIAFYNLSVIYTFLEDFEKAANYARETRRIALATGEKEYLVRGYISVSEAFINLKLYDSLFENAQKGLALATQYDMSFAIAKFNEQLGIYYARQTKQFDSAIVKLNRALGIFKQINTQYDVVVVLQNLGNAYLNTKDYYSAVKYSTEALELASSLQLDQIQFFCLKDLVEAHEKLGNISESYAYLKKFVTVNDSLLVRNNRRIVGELETKFQTQKKEAQLLVQQKIIREKDLLNYILAAAAVSALIIIFLLYRTYQQKQKLQQQRLNELETEKQLMATEAVLKGEEQERSRLAKDLHDGLGGLLSGIKYSFQNLKGNMVMTSENQVAFERGIDMLDSSIKEMRRVAHNMMPEALLKFGLDTALRDFCNDINQSKAISLTYQSLGMEANSLDQTSSITIYRIVQELVNNIIKHAAATNGLVQVAAADSKVSITVEDDGKGFEASALKASKGIGWSNIESRVEFLKGTMDVQSTKGKGTSVHIEIPG